MSWSLLAWRLDALVFAVAVSAWKTSMMPLAEERAAPRAMPMLIETLAALVSVLVLMLQQGRLPRRPMQLATSSPNLNRGLIWRPSWTAAKPAPGPKLRPAARRRRPSRLPSASDTSTTCSRWSCRRSPASRAILRHVLLGGTRTCLVRGWRGSRGRRDLPELAR